MALGHHRGGGLAKAIDYSLKRWLALSRYATAGRLPIDNNPVENIIQPIAIGKKNWLFTGSERAGKRAAAIQTLLGTAKLNGLDPAAWLRDTLEKLPTCLNSEIDSCCRYVPTSYTLNVVSERGRIERLRCAYLIARPI